MLSKTKGSKTKQNDTHVREMSTDKRTHFEVGLRYNKDTIKPSRWRSHIKEGDKFNLQRRITAMTVMVSD